ncbi:S-adenosyl-L-methionine-dependent methyltransferase [Aspergillus spinulosporus]
MCHCTAATCDCPERVPGSGDLILSSTDPSDEDFGPLDTLTPSTQPSSPWSNSSARNRRYSSGTGDGYESTRSSLSTEPLDEEPYEVIWLEIDRQFRQCQAIRQYLGKLIHGPARDPKVILDIGTGAGYWAIELADAFPGAGVYGIDIVCGQPEWVPPNCSFIRDDVAQPDWYEARFYQNADLVRVDKIFGDIPVLTSILKGAHHCCAPGGVVEIHDLVVQLEDYNETTPFHQFYRDLKEAYQQDNRVLDTVNAYQQSLEDNGFQQVRSVFRKIPLCAPRDPKQEEIYQAWLDSFEAISLRLFREHLGKCPWEVIPEIASARKSLQQGIKGSLIMLALPFSFLG